MDTYFKNFLRKLVSQQQIAAAKKRGLVPQSGNWQKPRRWVSANRQGQTNNKLSNINSIMQRESKDKVSEDDSGRERRKSLLSSLGVGDSSEGKIREEAYHARGRSIFSGVYNKNIDDVIEISKKYMSTHDQKFDDLEDKYNVALNRGLAQFKKVYDKSNVLADKYRTLDSKYNDIDEIPNRSLEEQDKLRLELTKLETEFISNQSKLDEYRPGTLILNKWKSVRKDLVKDFRTQLKEDKNYSAKNQREIVKNYGSLVDKAQFERNNRKDLDEELFSVNTSLDFMLRNVAQLLPSNFYKGINTIGVLEDYHPEGLDYMHYVNDRGHIDLSSGAIESSRILPYNTYAIIHEIGHSVHLNLLDYFPNNLGYYFTPEDKDKNIKLFNHNLGLFDGAKSNVDKFYTEYSKSNHKEFFAEAFAGYFGSGKAPFRPESGESLAYKDIDVFKYMSLVEETINSESNVEALSTIESKFADNREERRKEYLDLHW